MSSSCWWVGEPTSMQETDGGARYLFGTLFGSFVFFLSFLVRLILRKRHRTCSRIIIWKVMDMNSYVGPSS